MHSADMTEKSLESKQHGTNWQEARMTMNNKTYQYKMETSIPFNWGLSWCLSLRLKQFFLSVHPSIICPNYTRDHTSVPCPSCLCYRGCHLCLPPKLLLRMGESHFSSSLCLRSKHWNRCHRLINSQPVIGGSWWRLELAMIKSSFASN